MDRGWYNSRPGEVGKFFMRIFAKEAPLEPRNDPPAGNILKAFRITERKKEKNNSMTDLKPHLKKTV